MLKAYKYRIYPDPDQQQALWKTIHGCRYVYNWALEQRKKAYEADEKMPSAFTLNKMLTVMKQDNDWLYECSSPALQFAIQNMDSAYKNFFRRVKTGGCAPGFPKFKSIRNPWQSFQMINNYHLNFDDKTIKLPKVKTPVMVVCDRKFEGKCKTGTVSVSGSDRWFVSILVDDGIPTPLPVQVQTQTTIQCNEPEFISEVIGPGFKIHEEKRIECLQRRLSRKVPGSKNYHKARKKLARVYERVSDRRNAFTHQHSAHLVNQFDQITVLPAMASDEFKLDHAYSEFVRQLDYKSKWSGKIVIISKE